MIQILSEEDIPSSPKRLDKMEFSVVMKKLCLKAFTKLFNPVITKGISTILSNPESKDFRKSEKLTTQQLTSLLKSRTHSVLTRLRSSLG